MGFPVKCRNKNYGYSLGVGEYNRDGSVDIYNHADTSDISDICNPGDVHIAHIKNEEAMEEAGWVDD